MTVDKNKLEISYALGKYFLRLNGRDISSAVAGFNVGSVDADDKPTITLDLVLDTIEITSLGDAEQVYMVNLTDETEALLASIGWTPPEENTRTFRVSRTEEDTSIHEKPRVKDSEGFGNLVEALYGVKKRPNLLDGLFDSLPRRIPRQDVYRASEPPTAPVCTCSALDRMSVDLRTVSAHHHVTCDYYQLDNESPDARD